MPLARVIKLVSQLILVFCLFYY